MGQIYVELDAGVANGIMTLGTSGSGQEEGYWLFWNENGYSGQGWFWDDANNYVQTGWQNYTPQCGYTHSKNEEGLKEHIAGGHADDLNDVLGGWDPGSKMIFVGENYDLFKSNGCLRDA